MLSGHEDFLGTSGEAGRRMGAAGRADAPAHGGQRSARLGSRRDSGGISEVSRACGLSRKAIAKGMREIEAGTAPPPGRVRQPGAGRKKITAQDPGLMPALERLIEPETRGAPESPLRWTCKSTRTLAAQLARHKHPISHMKVAQLLGARGYSLQGNRKTEEGGEHPDRDAQFRHINTQVRRALAKGTPIISVDTKKKELVGNYENKGRQWLPGKKPVKVQGHDFPHPDVPRAYPYGIYDLERNTGFVNVGTDHDTGAFAVASIRGWWRHEGRRLYPQAKHVLITADGGGSNGSRLRLWKLELQKLADYTGLFLSVSHFPPGTSPGAPGEQDRTPLVLLHFLELARRTVAGLRDDREADLSNRHGPRSQSDLSLGPAQISDGPQGDG